MSKISRIVNLAFREIIEKGCFDVEKGNEPIRSVFNESMSVIPDAMTDYINSCGYGAVLCFQHIC